MIGDLFVFLFYSCPVSSFEEEVQRHAKKVKEYLEPVKDFDELVSPQSLFLHFLGPKPSTKVQKNLEVVRKSTCFWLLLFLFFLFFFILTFASFF